MSMSKRFISFFVLIAFLANLNTPYAQSAHPSVDISSAPKRLLGLNQLEIPSRIGKAENISKGTNGKTVILIQDAHAIPDAQTNIQKLIDHFQKHYGVSLVAVEGAASQLDPQIFRSFPDKKILQAVFNEYQKKGELTGTTAAAIFNEAPAIYHGIEDWKLYEEGLYFYLLAMQNEEELNKKLEVGSSKLEIEKKKVYSKQLLEIDALLNSFYKNQANLVDVLKKLAAIHEPESRELKALLDEVRNEAKDQTAIGIEVKRIAALVHSSLRAKPRLPKWKSSSSSVGQGSNLKAFNEKFQEFQTSRISPEAFALFLKETIVENHLPIKMSNQLLGLTDQQKMLKQIEGTKLFKDFEIYAAGVKDSLIQNEEVRNLDKETTKVRLLKKLIHLELNVDDWKKIKHSAKSIEQSENLFSNDAMRSALGPMLKSHWQFYENTEKRDHAFVSNIARLMNQGKTDSAILISGGFHTEGVKEELKQRGFSCITIFPTIDSLPEHSLYRDHMTGQVSWKDYLHVEDGKLNVYSAFIRATRDLLLKHQNQTSEGLLKAWRDQIIRDLASQGKIESTSDYLRFLDEVITKSRQSNDFEKGLVRVDQFIEGLKRLKSEDHFNQQNILQLFKAGTILGGLDIPLRQDPIHVGNNRLELRSGHLIARAEVRADDARSRTEAVNKAESIDEVMEVVTKYYPEMTWLTGDVNATPEKTVATEGLSTVSERLFGVKHSEFDRTAVGIMTFLWVLKGKYEKFTEVQSTGKLTRESFEELKEYTEKILGESPEALDALIAYTVINDIGKIKSVVKAVWDQSGKEVLDHDVVLLELLEKSSEAVPSFNRLSDSYKSLILKGLKAQFNFGQFVQAENVPASLQGLIGLDPAAMDFYMLHVIYDIAGAAGQGKQNGSIIVTEPTYQGFKQGISALGRLAQGASLTEAYDAFLGQKAKIYGLDIQNPRHRVVVRIATMMRLPDAQKVKDLLDVFDDLTSNEQGILESELNRAGVNDGFAVLLYYAPATLANAQGALQKAGIPDAFKRSLKIILKTFARVFQESRIALKNRNGNGVYTVNISELAKLASLDPEQIAHKKFELQKIGHDANLIVKDPSKIDQTQFSSMENLSFLAGGSIIPVGIGGGSDVLQAAIIGLLLKKAGKKVPAVISVRTAKTGSQSVAGRLGEERTVENHGGEIFPGVFKVMEHSTGSGRFLENIPVADGLPVYLVIDHQNGKLAEQIQAVVKHVGGTDQILAVDTGGDALHRNVGADNAKATPDQDLRVLEALKNVKLPVSTVEIAVGVDTPDDGREVLSVANAVFYHPNTEESKEILDIYKRWEIDGTNETRYGKTPFAWQAALRGETGFVTLPLPLRVVLDRKNPWDPFVNISESMAGIFIMTLENHLKAISRSELRMNIISKIISMATARFQRERSRQLDETPAPSETPSGEDKNRITTELILEIVQNGANQFKSDDSNARVIPNHIGGKEKPVFNVEGLKDQQVLSYNQVRSYLKQDRRELEEIAVEISEAEHKTVTADDILDRIVHRMAELLASSLEPARVKHMENFSPQKQGAPRKASNLNAIEVLEDGAYVIDPMRSGASMMKMFFGNHGLLALDTLFLFLDKDESWKIRTMRMNVYSIAPVKAGIFQKGIPSDDLYERSKIGIDPHWDQTYPNSPKVFWQRHMAATPPKWQRAADGNGWTSQPKPKTETNRPELRNQRSELRKIASLTIDHLIKDDFTAEDKTRLSNQIARYFDSEAVISEFLQIRAELRFTPSPKNSVNPAAIQATFNKESSHLIALIQKVLGKSSDQKLDLSFEIKRGSESKTMTTALLHFAASIGRLFLTGDGTNQAAEIEQATGVNVTTTNSLEFYKPDTNVQGLIPLIQADDQGYAGKNAAVLAIGMNSQGLDPTGTLSYYTEQYGELVKTGIAIAAAKSKESRVQIISRLEIRNFDGLDQDVINLLNAILQISNQVVSFGKNGIIVNAVAIAAFIAYRAEMRIKASA